jgi:hypothetical protein
MLIRVRQQGGTMPNAHQLPERTRPDASPTLFPRAQRFLNLFGVRADPADPRLAALRAATLQSDALADALVEAMEQAPRGQGRRMFEQALEHGIASVERPLPALTALFAQIESAPAWLDRAQTKRGSEAMLRQGAEGLCALSAVSLMGGYLSSNAVKPLAHTGALTKAAPRRLAETTQFVWAVATSAGMQRDSAGFKTTVRVRLMHAFVRRGLAASPDWRKEQWGIPINQRDMVATHLSFTLLFIAGVSAMGRVVTRNERDAIVHLWRYVSFLLGTPDALLPKTFREASEVGALFNISEPGPDADGRALASALMAAWSAGGPPGLARLPGHVFGSFMRGLSRYALGNEAADRLGIPDTRWKHLPPLLALVRMSFELLDLAVPGRRSRAIEAGRTLLDRHLSGTLGGKPARYVAPQEMVSA